MVSATQLSARDLEKLAGELSREDLQVYTVVRMAQQDLLRGEVLSALARLRVDADKLRSYDTFINELLARTAVREGAIAEFIVFRGEWKDHFVDHRGVLQDSPYGVPAQLAFIACRSPRLGWAHVSNDSVPLQLIAERLLALNGAGTPALVFTSAALRKDLKRFLPDSWSLPAGGESPAGILKRFSSRTNISVGTHRKESSFDAETLRRHPEATTKVGAILWVNQYQLQAWNAALESCTDLLLGSEEPIAAVRTDREMRSSFDFHNELTDFQRNLPPLAAPPMYREPYQGVPLDGEENYPRTVEEALEDWVLDANTQAAVRRIPWPAVRELLTQRALALEEHLEPEDARKLTAYIYANQDWAQTNAALDLLEEHATWYATFPAYKVMDPRSERVKALREDPLLIAMLGEPMIQGKFYLGYDEWTQRFLRRCFPVFDVEKASGEQLIFCATAISAVESLELEDSRALSFLEALLGLKPRELEFVRNWRDSTQGRRPNSWGLSPDVAMAAIERLWSALGTAPKRWIRLEELSVRLQGSEPWARSNNGNSGISPALLVQAAAGLDCRILLAGPDDVRDYEGPNLRGLVCAGPVARKIIQAGCHEPSAFPPGLKRTVEADTGPLPTTNCVYFCLS